jgi:hypothetical protein
VFCVKPRADKTAVAVGIQTLHLPRWYVELELLAERTVDDVSIMSFGDWECVMGQR